MKKLFSLTLLTLMHGVYAEMDMNSGNPAFERFESVPEGEQKLDGHHFPIEQPERIVEFIISNTTQNK